MTAKILCLCEPAVYPRKIGETPELYQKLAAADGVELFHVGWERTVQV